MDQMSTADFDRYQLKKTRDRLLALQTEHNDLESAYKQQCDMTVSVQRNLTQQSKKVEVLNRELGCVEHDMRAHVNRLSAQLVRKDKAMAEMQKEMQKQKEGHLKEQGHLQAEVRASRTRVFQMPDAPKASLQGRQVSWSAWGETAPIAPLSSQRGVQNDQPWRAFEMQTKPRNPLSTVAPTQRERRGWITIDSLDNLGSHLVASRAKLAQIEADATMSLQESRRRLEQRETSLV
jgi:hypothetical protein